MPWCESQCYEWKRTNQHQEKFGKERIRGGIQSSILFSLLGRWESKDVLSQGNRKSRRKNYFPFNMKKEWGPPCASVVKNQNPLTLLHISLEFRRDLFVVIICLQLRFCYRGPFSSTGIWDFTFSFPVANRRNLKTSFLLSTFSHFSVGYFIKL